MSDKKNTKKDNQEAFLHALELNNGITTAALKAVNITYRTLTNWRKDPVFIEEMDASKAIGRDMYLDFLEEKAKERIENEEKPSDSVLIFSLKTIGRKRGYNENPTSEKGVNNNSYLTLAQQISIIYTLNIQKARNNRIIVNRGGTRSTKSYSIAQIAVDWLLGGRELYKDATENKVFSIVRKSSPVLKATVIKDVVNLLKERNVYGQEVEHHKTEKEFKYKDRILDYFSLDDEQKVRGRKRDYLFIDEANECDYETFTQLMFRTAGTCFLAFNPDDPHVWINTKIEQERAKVEGDVAVIISSYLVNPFLSAAQVREIEMLRELDAEYWQVFGLGEYGVITGLVYKEVYQFKDLPKDRKLHRVLGFDYGSEVDPSAILEIYIDIKAHEVYVYEKLYETTDRLSMIYDVLGRERDEIVIDNSASTLINELTNKGYNAVKCVKGADSILAGIDIVKKYKLHIHESAINTLKETKLYKRPKDNNGNYLKKPLDLYNHAMDALRYAVVHVDQYYNFNRLK